MKELIKLQKKIVPEFIQLIQKRYDILRSIYYYQPIGRRALSNKLKISERIVRNEIDFLKKQELIVVNSQGMMVTKCGEEIIHKLNDFMYEIKGISQIEKSIRDALNLKKVIIVPGDVEEDPSVMHELGKAGATYLESILNDNITISVTGGTTVKSIVDNVKENCKFKGILVLPARGGMNKDVSIQANSLAAHLAEKLNGNYRLLHVPYNLSKNALDAMLKEKEIKKLVEKIHSFDILLFGIGKAEQMALKRGLNSTQVENLLKKKAVGEAFGYYFNENGEIVYFSPTIGITRDDINNNNIVITAAAGKSKAKAILSVERNIKTGVLITDEGASREMLELLKNKQ